MQKGEVISRDSVDGADHFYQGRQDVLMDKLNAYLDQRLDAAEAKLRLEAENE